MHTQHRWLTTMLLLLACTLGARAQEMALVPADGVIRLTEYGYRDWGPEVLQYRVDTKAFRPGKLALLGPDGAAVPFQISDGVLSFVAALAKGQTAEYRLVASPGDRARANSAVRVRKDGTSLEIGNALFAIRVPAPRAQQYPGGKTVDQVPVPFLGVQQQGKAWCGGAHFITARTVTGFQARVVEEGPATVLYEARYTFAPRGAYLWRIRVSDGLPYAVVNEEFDFGEVGEGKDFLVLDLQTGWTPAEVRYIDWGAPRNEPLAAYLAKKATETAAVQQNVSPQAPSPFIKPGGDTLVFLERFTTTGAWGPRAGFGLGSPEQSLTVLPIHTGAWRRAMALTAWHDPERGVGVALPISVRPVRWYSETTEDQSPFSTHTHDTSLPASYGRRVWLLVVGNENPSTLHVRVGFVGLNRYKDWIVDWPVDAAKARYPRAFTTPALAARLRKSLDQHPDKAELGKFYVITGDTAMAAAHAQQAIRLLRQPPNAQPWTVWGFTGYRDPDFYLWLARAEDALAWPDLPTEQRAEIRRRLALLAYLYTDADAWAAGSGSHLGTPNMSMGAGITGIYFSALLPDHPRYAYWMTHYRDFVAYWLANYTTAGGAWFEPPTYQLFGPTRWLSTAQILLRNGGWGDLTANGLHAAVLRYNAHLTMPDPRFKGWRILPGMGNSGNTLEGIWGLGVGVTEASDPEAAGFFADMHARASGNRRVGFGAEDPGYAFFSLPDVPAKSQPLATTYIPGYGVAFRAHFGSPDETAMLFRCGYNRSHWDVDDQNVILYGKGAPLSPGTAYQYYFGIARQSGPVSNQCRIVDATRGDTNGRIQTDVQDYGFGPNADYAVGRMYLSKEEIGDGKGDMEWRRHIQFLKSDTPAGANYFVMRDTFTGNEGAPVKEGRKAWWSWLNLGPADRVRVDGTAFDATKVSVDKLTPPDQQPALRGNTLEMATEFGASSWFWFDTPQQPEVKAVMTFITDLAPNYHHRVFGGALGVPNAGLKEAKTIFRIEGTTDDGFSYVLYPRKGGEPTPACTRLAPGCLKIVTPESTDYVFISDTPLAFDQDGVAFTGKAGAVRVFKDRVVLSMNSGSGRIAYHGLVLTGHGPFERTVKLADMTAGEQNVGGYEKKIVTVDLGRGLTVRGEMPFTARLEGDQVKIRTEGRARQFILSWPNWLMHPQYFLDGQEYMVFVSDYASQNWGRYGGAYGMCLSTRDGAHDLVIRPRVWPKPWDDGTVRQLGGVTK